MTTTPPAAEEVLWKGSPSQVMNLKVYVICGLLCWLIVPIFIALWKWFDLRHHEYRLTTERLTLQTGLFTRTTDALELYRVRDIVIQEPLVYRMFGAGNIVMQTSDSSHPTFTLHAIKAPHAIHEHLRRQVEAMRAQKRVREVDFE